MSTLSFRRIGRSGLLAVGLCCLSGLAVAVPQQGPAPSAVETPAPADPGGKVVLLTDGRVLVGELSEEGKVVVLKQKAGTLRLAKKQVEGTFDSIAEIYKYKVDQIAD